MEKAFNRCVFLPASSSLFCFITSALCSADNTVSVAEGVWRHCGLAETWKTLWCSVLRCSSGLRGEISLAVPLTTRDWTIEMVLPPLTERRISCSSISRQKSVAQTPRYQQQESNRKIVFWFVYPLLSFRHLSLFSGDKFLQGLGVICIPFLLLEISWEQLWQRRR